MSELKIGDEIRILKDSRNVIPKGLIMRVVGFGSVNTDIGLIEVKLDKRRLEALEQTWYFYREELELFRKKKTKKRKSIEITHDLINVDLIRLLKFEGRKEEAKQLLKDFKDGLPIRLKREKRTNKSRNLLEVANKLWKERGKN